MRDSGGEGYCSSSVLSWAELADLWKESGGEFIPEAPKPVDRSLHVGLPVIPLVIADEP